MSEDNLKRLRDQVEAIDIALLKGLNERARVCLEIGRLKGQNGIEIDDPDRERAIFSYLTRANSGPLDDREVKEIFRAVFTSSKRLQSSTTIDAAAHETATGRVPHHLTGKAHAYCILGNPVGHSMSPIMHNAAFRLLGLDAVYLPFEVEDLPGAVEALKALRFKGASVTVPFKKDVMSLVDKIDETAEKIGAVNTLLLEDGGVQGTNTDWIGALRCLETLLPVSGNTFVILGAGGAARAVVYAVVESGGKAVLVNRSEEKGQALAEEFSAAFVPLHHIEEVDGDCLVNTTPVGMHPREHVMPVEKKILARYKAVADVVYNPMKTMLLREAEAAGCSTASGFEMFIYQGVEQFQIWTGQKAPVDAMRQVVYERLSKQ